MKISERNFIVTGAGSGLGEATARALVGAGGNVVIADIDRANGERVAESLARSARFVATDVTSEESVIAAITTVRQAFGPLSGAVSCAGIGNPAKVLGKEGPHTLDLFSRVIGINLVGTFNVLRLSAHAMAGNEPNAEGERGVIINTASIAAFEGQVGQAAYAASKGGVVALTLPTARELARFGIRVVTLAPGLFDTPLLAGLPEKAKRLLGEQVPFPSRLGRPAEYADLALQVIRNVMINGETLRLDGALRMAPQ